MRGSPLKRGTPPSVEDRSDSPGEPHPDRFARAFRLGLSLCLAGTAGFNWVVNPWGLYAPRVVRAAASDLCRRKCDLLRRCDPPPQQLVLGSSRSLWFEPDLLERRTGLRTFNAAITDASVLHYLALTRLALEELRAPLRSVLIGIEAPAFCGRSGAMAVASEPALAPFVPVRERFSAAAARLTLLTSARQTGDSWEAIQRALNGTQASGDGRGRLRPDGMPIRPPDEAAFRRQLDLPAAVVAQLRTPYMNPGPVQPAAVKEFGELLALLHRRGIAATVVVTPALPAARHHWRRTGFLGEEQRVLKQAAALSAAHGARFVDFSTVERFGGDPNEFWDAVHPRVPNMRRMIEALFPR